MDFANSLLELLNNLWGLASRSLGYGCYLKANAKSLRTTTDKLKAKIKDVLTRVECEVGGGGVQCKEEVGNWLDTVQKFVGRVDQILRQTEERDQIKCLNRYLPPNCWSTYELGKRVDQMLNEAKELQQEGEFDVVTLPLPPNSVLDIPMDETVGLDISNLNEVWKWVVDKKQVGVIGLYGTGGEGKTTLMRRINKKLSHANNGFDVVIWVLVSKPMDKDRIQDDIRRRLGVNDEQWERWSWDERVHYLCQALTRRKFVLLLDDLWELLDLSEIGVPRPILQDGSKVVFTTRQVQVCDQMEADEIFEVPCLTHEKALELFKNKVGRMTMRSHPQIPELAEEVARECKGLPLALTVVGRAMAGRKDPDEWKHALTILKKTPHELSGMEEVYHKLAFSYDSLNNPRFQRCFLYCCLFPEDYSISTDYLIELWIGGGLARKY